MSDPAEVLFVLLRFALGNGNDFSLPNAINWQEVFDLANQQGVDALAWTNELSERSNGLGIDETLKYKWIGHQALVEKENYYKFKSINSLCELWASEGIKPVVLKGLSYAMLYPTPLHRRSCDLDSFLFERWEDGNAIVEKQGIPVCRNYYKNSSFIYQGLYVENHRYCSPIRGGKQRKRYELFLRNLLESSDLELIPGTESYTPPPLFNLLFFLSHAQNHFLNEGGIRLRHVCDWGVLMRAYANVSGLWDKVLRYSEEFGFNRFLYSISQVACRVCGAQIPFYCPQDEIADAALLEDIISPKCSRVEFAQGWHTRKLLVKSIMQSQWKFEMFSNQRMLPAFSMGLSFLFEKKPVLKK